MKVAMPVFVMSDDDARVRRVTAAVRDACPSAAIDEAPLRAFIRSLRALSVGGGGGGGSSGGGGGDGGSESGGGSGGGGSGGRRGGGARDHLAFILDYDLTLSRGGGIECHSFFGVPGAPAASKIIRAAAPRGASGLLRAGTAIRPGPGQRGQARGPGQAGPGQAAAFRTGRSRDSDARLLV